MFKLAGRVGDVLERKKTYRFRQTLMGGKIFSWQQ